jgi:hypothetical protein
LNLTMLFQADRRLKPFLAPRTSWRVPRGPGQTTFTAILNIPFAVMGSASTHFSAIYPLTYKIPWSYTPTVKTGILINIGVCGAI